MTDHHVHVSRTDGRRTWRAHCVGCGWSSEHRRNSRAAAEVDADDHTTENTTTLEGVHA